MRRGACSFLLAGRFHRLAWVEWGPEDGAPVLCVHGLTRNGRDFDALAHALAAQGRRVICPDLPGRGASDWLPDPALYQPPSYVVALAHLLARLDGPVDWVGTSLGGICGMLVAAGPGNPIRKLVLNDVGARIPAEALARIGAYLAAAPTVFADLAAVEAYLARVHAPFGPGTDFAHLARHSVREVPGGLALHYDPAIAAPFNAAPPADADLSMVWALGTAPTLIIRGESSDLLTGSDARAMAAKPGARLLEIAGAGHAPSLMNDAQIQALQGFLAES
ncbi:alpha/beta fold hydrolase [Roseococcus sp. DSY-14]|uniref:alpha/beta fold hydrolase n=1 Tax=Roseococcus sp. DSY-14 TaxID=3369650 RepID=UPI00387B543A